MNESAGQLMLVPVHFSATSQAPTDARHSAEAGFKLSEGQTALVPLQNSATSQVPAAARHSVVVALNTSAGQVGAVPSHVSATSQTPDAERQVEPFLAIVQVPSMPPPAATLHT
jgi:hypothetical protein